mmetsp:Transcript_4858/g.5910  ORF Transcript_4858/g.5910 Transcript_4858/m.5910 type:complete len:101 (-) Transcript_4858:1367-1669(-)
MLEKKINVRMQVKQKDTIEHQCLAADHRKKTCVGCTKKRLNREELYERALDQILEHHTAPKTPLLPTHIRRLNTMEPISPNAKKQLSRMSDSGTSKMSSK